MLKMLGKHTYFLLSLHGVQTTFSEQQARPASVITLLVPKQATQFQAVPNSSEAAGFLLCLLSGKLKKDKKG
jgi:hypothetical protein